MASPCLMLWLSLLCCPKVIIGNLQLLFDTPKYVNSDDYYALEGQIVTLTCITSSEAASVYIYKGTSAGGQIVLSDDGRASEAVTTSGGKYVFHSSGREYYLVINNLTKSDSFHYRCVGNIQNNCNGFQCDGIASCPLRRESATVFLSVTETLTVSGLIRPDFCSLLGNTEGVYFTGEDLILRCPEPVTIKVSTQEDFKIVFEETHDIGGYVFFTIRSLDGRLNGATLFCILPSISLESIVDYCRHISPITVLEGLSVSLIPSYAIIERDRNVIFTCRSNIFIPYSMEWTVVGLDVLFSSVSCTETEEGSQLFFQNVTSKSFVNSACRVICNVTIGSKNAVGTATLMKNFEGESTTTPLINSSVGEDLRSTIESAGSERVTRVIPSTRVIPISEGENNIKKLIIYIGAAVSAIMVIFMITCFVLIYKLCNRTNEKSTDDLHSNYLTYVGPYEGSQDTIRQHENTPTVPNTRPTNEGEYCYADPMEMNVLMIIEDSVQYQNITK